MSGIGGRAPRYAPFEFLGRTVNIHRHALMLPLTPNRPRVRRLGVMPLPGEWQAAAYQLETARRTRSAAAAARRDRQRADRIAAGVDRSSPDAGPRPRWSR